MSVSYFARPGLQRVVMHSGNAVLMQYEFDDERAMKHEGFKKLIQFEGSVVQEAMRATEVWRSPWLDANEEQA